MKHYKLSVLTLALAAAGFSTSGFAAQEAAADAGKKLTPTEARAKAKAEAAVEKSICFPKEVIKYPSIPKYF